MIHIIISDTHAPNCLSKARDYSKDIVEKIPEVDAIMVNGDILGVFSMDESCIYKGRDIKPEERLAYFNDAAPKFVKELKEKKEITQEMVYAFVKERYEWTITELIKFAKINFTIFNLGNHESKIHFLVLNELPFLTGCNPRLIENLDEERLNSIFDNWEKELYELEKTHQFRYIRNAPIIIEETLIFGVPGESHGTVGNNFAAKAQEKKTKELIELAKPMLAKIKGIIIYNHTQGDYDMITGKHDTASPSLKKFMMSLPENIKTRVFIQSHNHWNQTQFMKHSGFYYIMNNAGLHDGLFNMVDFNEERVNCYDLDPVQKKTIKLVLNKNFAPLKSKRELLMRNYPNPDYIDIRKNVHKTLNVLNL